MIKASNLKLLLNFSYHKEKQIFTSKQFLVSQRETSPYIRAISHITKGNKFLHQGDNSRTTKGNKSLHQGNFPYYQGKQVPTSNWAPHTKGITFLIRASSPKLLLGSPYHKGDHVPDQGVKSQITTGLPVPQRGTSPYIRVTSRIIKGNKSLFRIELLIQRGSRP